MNSIVFKIGQIAPAPFWPSHVRDGAHMIQDANGGVFVTIYLDRPTPQEMDILSQPIMTRYFVRDDGCNLWLLRMGASLIFDLAQDPHLWDAGDPQERIELWETQNLWQITVIDCSSGIVKKIRMATAPEELRREISKAMAAALKTPDFTSIYRQYLDYYQKKSLESLWDKAVPSGMFGENYSMILK